MKSEYIGNSGEAISVRGVGSGEKALSLGMAPRGSASITKSGKLAETGIKSIIHIAAGSMSSSEKELAPSLEGAVLGVKNGLFLAKKSGHHCAAIPFIGSGIFLARSGVTKPKLAQELYNAVREDIGDMKAVFVAYSKEDHDLFKGLVDRGPKDIKLVQGSITDFSLHKCDVIFNAANTELVFGGGLSGHIGGKTGARQEIDSINKKLIERLKNEN